jgi:hypothetical protein
MRKQVCRCIVFQASLNNEMFLGAGLDLVRRETNREFNIIGWDRTPLYISLLRILLWAEGLVHQSLDVDQMLYLTVAYDWLLFGYAYRIL